MKKRVGILGGTFDPPHLGHLIIANEVLHALKLNEIRFMPNQEPPHKERKSSVTNRNRAKMISLSIEGNPFYKIETIELKRTGRSYTYDTILLLKERDPNVEFFFIIGADMIEYLPKWYNIEKLINLVQFVGVKRPSHSHETNYPIIHIDDIPEINISSTMIRKRLMDRHSVKYLVTDKVIDYIKEHNLYGAE